jgi:DNA-binding CsgD family transcriptional regulator
VSRLWTLDDGAAGTWCDSAHVAGLLDNLQRQPPGLAALRFIHRLVPLEHLSIVEHAADRPPRYVESHARLHGRHDEVGQRCFALYLDRFRHADELPALVVDLLRRAAGERPLQVLHFHQHEVPQRSWREAVFEREGLAGRLSYLFDGPADTVYAVNVFRHVACGAFTDDELRCLVHLAPLLRAALRPSLDRLRPRPAAPRVAAVELRLAACHPALSGREREVAARIACGLSNDGIAADLALSPATVVTLRKRVYAKLGIHSRMPLLRLA